MSAAYWADKSEVVGDNYGYGKSMFPMGNKKKTMKSKKRKKPAGKECTNGGVPHLKDGSLFKGATHKMDDGSLHTGAKHTSSSEKLFDLKDSKAGKAKSIDSYAESK